MFDLLAFFVLLNINYRIFLIIIFGWNIVSGMRVYPGGMHDFDYKDSSDSFLRKSSMGIILGIVFVINGFVIQNFLYSFILSLITAVGLARATKRDMFRDIWVVHFLPAFFIRWNSKYVWPRIFDYCLWGSIVLMFLMEGVIMDYLSSH